MCGTVVAWGPLRQTIFGTSCYCRFGVVVLKFISDKAAAEIQRNYSKLDSRLYAIDDLTFMWVFLLWDVKFNESHVNK